MDDVRELARRAKVAGRVVARARTGQKQAALGLAAELLEERTAEILAANEADVAEASSLGATPTELDRLTLSASRIAAMAAGLRQVAGLPDPVGEVIDGWRRPNGLMVERVRVPLGVVAVIYENRPNVTSDAAGLCLASGNAVVLRGSSTALRSNQTVASCLRDGLVKAGLPADAVILVEDTSREAAVELMRCDGLVDCLIPRGGPSLIETIREHATVPSVIDGEGNCHVYVDAAADFDRALAIIVNAKTQRPGVCNAAETLLVHRDVADRFLPAAAAALDGVELRGDAAARSVVPSMTPATEADFAREFLAPVLAVAVVDDLNAAIEHIDRYGTGHSEAIVTADIDAARRFCGEVDAAAVVVNASTRFVDGEELGLGAEIGISTQKLHARGPMGLRELTCTKFVLTGAGHVR